MSSYEVRLIHFQIPLNPLVQTILFFRFSCPALHGAYLQRTTSISSSFEKVIGPIDQNAMSDRNAGSRIKFGGSWRLAGIKKSECAQRSLRLRSFGKYSRVKTRWRSYDLFRHRTALLVSISFSFFLKSSCGIDEPIARVSKPLALAIILAQVNLITS
jgi:hypothetical protein